MFVVCPSVTLNSIIFQVLQHSNRKLTTLRNDFSTCVVLHTLRHFVLCKHHQLVHENIFQIVNLGVIFFVDLSKDYLILFLAFTCLDSA